METLMAVWSWLQAHPVVVGIAFYVLLNIAPRIKEPAPGWRHTLWAAFEMVMVLPWDRWLGLPKTMTWQSLDGKVVLPDTPAVRNLTVSEPKVLDRDTDPTGK